MGFLAPWFLAGLAVAGLPLWLHLLRQFKRTPQEFSSLMFFERRIQSSTKHRRLRYLTLLSLRLLLLLLIVLAFANPFINRLLAAGGKRTVTVIAIDRSFSMRAGNRLREAKLEARHLVDSLGDRDLAEVLAFDSHVEALTTLQAGKGPLQAAVDSVEPTDLSSSFGELARAVRVLAETKGTQVQVHLFSDMQQSSMPASFRDLALAPGTAMTLHPVAQADTPNWAVTSVTTAPRIFDTKNVKVDASVQGWKTEAVTRKVSLLLDGRAVASKDVNIPAGGRSPVQFTGFEIPYGSHRGSVALDSRDTLPADDVFGFTVERLDPRPVLFLYAKGRSRAAFYYKSALESSSDTGLKIEPFPVEQLGGKNLANYAFVVLHDVGELDTSTAQKLCSYLQHGGSALIAAGPEAVRSGRVPLSNYRTSADGLTQPAGTVDDGSLALAGAGHFQNVQFFGGTSITSKPEVRVLARLADRTPLLLEERMGEGKLLTFASTLDNTTNDFPLHASYLPFVAQTARYLSGTEDAQGSVVTGTPVALRRSTADAGTADVVGPDGKHELSLDQAKKALSFDLVRAGYYEIGKAQGQRTPVAVNADRRESDLTRVPAETLDLWRNTGGAGSASGKASAEIEPVSYWRSLLVLAVLAALIESLFAVRYLSKAST